MADDKGIELFMAIRFSLGTENGERALIIRRPIGKISPRNEKNDLNWFSRG
jgi:hypothetical protein